MAPAQVKAKSPRDPVKRPSLQGYGSVNKALLLQRGWTRTAIKRILGEPDRRITLRRRRKDRPECLYDVARVQAAEEAGVIRFRRVPDRNREDPGDVTRTKACTYCGWPFDYLPRAI